MRLDDIAAALPGLPATELQKLRDQVTVLLAIGPKGGEVLSSNGKPDAFVPLLYDALAAELKRATQAKAAPFSLFAKSSTYENHFKPGALVAAEANARWFPRQTRVEQASMATLYARLCVQWLQQQSRPLAWFSINFALQALPEIVDQAFPGYAASGLLGKVQLARTRRP
jgi:hypothetical protein